METDRAPRIDYVSEVAIVLTRRAEGLIVWQRSCLLDRDLQKSIKSLFAFAERLESDEGDFVLLHWAEFQWHDEDPAVAWLLRELRLQDAANWGMWRVGESLNDDEWLGALTDTPFELDLRRALVFNRPVRSGDAVLVH